MADFQPECLYRDDLAEVWHADALDAEHAAIVMGERVADLLCVDAPYSEKTHSGHNKQQKVRELDRRSIAYSCWVPADIKTFCGIWVPRCSGWVVSLTDDTLFQHWRSELSGSGLYTFQDIPCVIRGMTVRLGGDGPSSWTVHAAVARRKTRALARWGTLDGAYVGASESQDVVGGKPLWLMGALVRDYSRPADLVVDACCGGGTTLAAAKAHGRRSIGIDVDRCHAELAALRVSQSRQQVSMPWAERSAG